MKQISEEKNKRAGMVFESIKNTGVFFVGSVLSKAISFLLLPLYTHYISKEGMGFFDLTQTYLNIIIPIVFVEVWAGIMRYLYASKGDADEKKVVSSGFLLFSISVVLYFLLALVISFLFPIRYFAWIVVMGLAQAVSTFYQFVSRGFRRNFDFALSGIISILVLSIVNISLILFFHFDELSLIVAISCGFLSQAIYLEVRLRVRKKIVRDAVDLVFIKKLIGYTFPLGINAISYWLLSSSNKMVINYYLNLEANGIYAISQKFSAVISLVTIAANYAWQDLAFRKSEEDAGDKFYTKASKIYWWIFIVGASLFIPFVYLVFPYLVGKNFGESINYIALGILAAMFSAFGTFLGNIFGAIKETRSVLVSTVISSVCNVLLSILLVPCFGIQGANVAVVLATLINVLIRLTVLNRLIHMKIEWLQYILGMVLFLFFSLEVEANY